MQAKYWNFVFCRVLFSLKFVGIDLVSPSYDLTFLYDLASRVYHWIIHNICTIFTIFATSCRRTPNIIFFTYIMFFTLTSTFIIILLLIWITFSSINSIFAFACMTYALLIFLIHLSCSTRLYLNLLFYLKHMLY